MIVLGNRVFDPETVVMYDFSRDGALSLDIATISKDSNTVLFVATGDEVRGLLDGLVLGSFQKEDVRRSAKLGCYPFVCPVCGTDFIENGVCAHQRSHEDGSNVY